MNMAHNSHKFSKGQKIVFQAAEGKFKGTVESVHSLEEGSYYEYDLKLTQKLGVPITTLSPAQGLKEEQKYSDIPHEQKYHVKEHNLSNV